MDCVSLFQTREKGFRQKNRLKSSNVLSNWIVLPTERGWGWLFAKQLSVSWEVRSGFFPRKAKEVLSGLLYLLGRETVNSDVPQISHVLSLRDRFSLLSRI